MNTYSTQSLALAAAISLWLPVDDIVWPEAGRAVFVFPMSQELVSLIELFHKGELSVDPRGYYYAIRELKGRLKDQRNI